MKNRWGDCSVFFTSGRFASVLGMVAAFSVGLTACSGGQLGSGSSQLSDGDGMGGGRVEVVAAFYPLAFLAHTVGGEYVNVTDLTPPGGHAHDLELSPGQVTTLKDADVVVYLGEGFQPAVATAVEQFAVTSMDGLEVVDDDVLIPGDAHVWLDPMIMAAMGDALAKQLSVLAPEHAETFESNASGLRDKLEQVDFQYRDVLSNCKGEPIVTSHEAFGYMAQAYGLEQIGIMGINPDAEPSPKRLLELEKQIEETGATTLFFEAQTASDAEQKMANALNMGVGQLETLESAPTTADDYVGALLANLNSLQAGLTCAEGEGK